MNRRTIALFAIGVLAAGCAGYRGGWESIAYLGDKPPTGLNDAAAPEEARRPPELSVPGMKLQVTIDNQLRTHDTQVYFFVVPLSVDPRAVYPKNNQPGKTRVYVTAVPQAPGFVFAPAAASLRIGEKRFPGAAGFEFGMWDPEWRRVERGGKWEHRAVNQELQLSEVGRRYYLSIDFSTPTPSPESAEIALDLSQALRSASQPQLPVIRFAPARWKEGYT